jgi:hypothetical protein
MVMLVAKQNEILAEQPHRDRCAAGGEFFGECHRMPIAAHELTAASAWTHTSQTIVVGFTLHASSTRYSSMVIRRTAAKLLDRFGE